MRQIRERFATNWNGFWDEWKLAAAVFFIAVLADALSTIHFMQYEGIESELHPMVNQLSRLCGEVAGPLIGAVFKGIAGIVVAVFWRRIAGFIFGLSSVVSLWAAWYNIWGYRIYQPAIYSWWPF